jgi:hypothetical protein
VLKNDNVFSISCLLSRFLAIRPLRPRQKLQSMRYSAPKTICFSVSLKALRLKIHINAFWSFFVSEQQGMHSSAMPFNATECIFDGKTLAP